MKRHPSPDELTDALISKILRYDLFVSAFRIVEAGCSADQLPRFRRQRAELVKKVGYNRLPGFPDVLKHYRSPK
jgi:hypothetical protein